MAKLPKGETNLRVVVRMAPDVYVKLLERAKQRRSTIGKLCVEGALREIETCSERAVQRADAAAME